MILQPQAACECVKTVLKDSSMRWWCTSAALNLTDLNAACMIGPVANALIKVPMPTGPPRSQPMNVTVVKRIMLSPPIGTFFILFESATRSVSLGPHPSDAVMYVYCVYAAIVSPRSITATPRTGEVYLGTGFILLKKSTIFKAERKVFELSIIQDFPGGYPPMLQSFESYTSKYE